MLVWDDTRPAQRLSIYDTGAHLGEVTERMRREALVAYRVGDMVAPALPETEALGQVAAEFRRSIVTRNLPETDGASGLRVLKLLDAAEKSLQSGGVPIPVAESDSLV